MIREKQKLTIAACFLLLVNCCSLAQDRPKIVIPTGHSGGVSSIHINESGNRLYSLGLDGMLKVWDMISAKEVLSIRVFEGKFKEMENTYLDVSPDDQYAVIATTTESGISVLDLRKAKIISTIKEYSTGLAGVQFLPGYASLIITTMNGPIVSDLHGNILRKYAQVSTDEISDGKLYPYLSALSPDGKILAVHYSNHLGGNRQSYIQTIDAGTGSFLHRFPLDAVFIGSLDFSFSSKELLVAMGSNFMHINLSTGQSRVSPMMGCHFARFIDNDNKIIACNKEGNMTLLNAKDFSRIGNDYNDNLFYRGKVSSFATTNTTGMIIRGITMEESDNTQYGRIQLFNINRAAIDRELSGIGAMTSSGSFNPSANKLLIASGDGIARIWDLGHGGIDKQIGKQEKALSYQPALHFRKALYSTNGNWLCLSESDNTVLYDTNFIQKQEIDNFNQEDFEESTDGSMIAMREGANSITVWKTPSTVQDKPALLSKFTAEAYSRGMKFLANGQMLVYSEFAAAIVDINSGKVITQLELENNRINTVAQLPDANYVILAGGFTEGVFGVFDIHSGRNISTLDLHKRMIVDVAVSARTKKMITASEDNTACIWDVRNPEKPAILFTLRGHTDELTSCRFSSDGQFALTTSKDKTAKIWSVATGKELCTFIGVDEDWIMITPEGYYFASRNGAKNIHFVKTGQVYNFDQYDLIYNRPDLVLKKIGMAPQTIIDAYRRAYEKRISKMGFDPSRLTASFAAGAPDIKVRQKKGAAAISTSEHTLSLIIDAEDKTESIDRLIVRVNGVPMNGRQGLPIKGDNLKVTREVSVMLSAGDNLIEVSAINRKGVESLSYTLSSQYTGLAETPTLYLVALGVSHYADSTMNLSYAAKDAEDISKRFVSNNKRYSSVVNLLLTDAQVSREALKKVKEKLLKTKPDDLVIVFYAGHGMTAGNDDYYLSPFTMNFEKPEQQGISFDEMEDLMDGIAARQKVLLVDACNSGEQDADLSSPSPIAAEMPITGMVRLRTGDRKPRRARTSSGSSSFDLMKELFIDLRRSTGTTVIASSSGVEYALEGDRWQNGVFTYSILNALEEKKSDTNRDGVITVSELFKYVQAQVVALTNGQQRPMSRAENIVVDFSIW